jgi:hypothetical protein
MRIGITFSFVFILYSSVFIYLNWIQILQAPSSNTSQHALTRSTKPMLIYHPGPPKMGTTSLQCALAELRNSLIIDGYFYAGKFPKKFCFGMANHEIKDLDCLFNITCQSISQSLCQKTGCAFDSLTSLRTKVDALYRERIHIIISDETHSIFHEKISNTGIPPLLFHDIFSNWTKHLVVGYRWYWQFWLSSRGELNGVFKADRKRSFSWKDRRLLSLLSMLQEETSTSSLLLPHTSSTLKSYSKYFDQISILSIHNNDDIIQSFLCQILQASYTCENYQPLSEHFNPSNDVMILTDIDRLVMESQHWINTTKNSRTKVVHTLFQMYIKQSDLGHFFLQNQNDNEFLECATPTMKQRLLDKSLEEEKRLFPHVSNREHIQKFLATSFCSLNISFILANEEWRNRMQSLFSYSSDTNSSLRRRTLFKYPYLSIQSSTFLYS